MGTAQAGLPSTIPASFSKPHRLAFIDALRGLAVLWMIETHVVNACLAPGYREHWLFGFLTLTNGFVAVGFLFFAGAGFWLAAERKAGEFRRLGPPLWIYLRRLALIFAVGYYLHLPSYSYRKLLTLPPDKWMKLFRVDILQVIALSSLVALILLLLVKRKTIVAGICGGLAAMVFLAAPMVLAWNSFAVLPPSVAAYFAPQPLVEFSLFPWSGYFLAGVALTALFTQSTDKPRLARWFIWAGLGVCLLAFTLKLTGAPYPGDTHWWRSAPSHSLFRTSGVLILFALFYFRDQRLTASRTGRFLQRSGQESLFIYFWHLFIVYGSIFSTGLGRSSGVRWSPLECALITAVIVAVMYWTASMWHSFKTAQPKAATWTVFSLVTLFLLAFFLNPALP